MDRLTDRARNDLKSVEGCKTPTHHLGRPRPAPVAQLVECQLRGTGGHRFDPGPRHTKVVKNGLAAPRLALRFTR